MLKALYYVPLESYESRYTYQLRTWAVQQFTPLCEAEGVKFVVIDSMFQNSDFEKIRLGQVLDAFRRPRHAMNQIDTLLNMLQNNEITGDSFILFEDMFHPGIEALFYALTQMQNAHLPIPKIGMRCLAQSIDPDDFTHYTGMSFWMTHYEQMVDAFIDCFFVASKEMISFMQIARWETDTFITGLPFCKQEVLTRAQPYEWLNRPYNIVFTSRLAEEKQPNFLGAVALALKAMLKTSPYDFSLLMGNNISNFDLATYPLFREAIYKGALFVKADLHKEEYYHELAQARVLFNCSLQDWVSNTASEASAYGCNLVFPAYRSFPEAFDNRADCMYVPWSIEDAVSKIFVALTKKFDHSFFADKQDGTNARTFTFIKERFYFDNEIFKNCSTIPFCPVEGESRKNFIPTENLQEQLSAFLSRRRLSGN